MEIGGIDKYMTRGNAEILGGVILAITTIYQWVRARGWKKGLIHVMEVIQSRKNGGHSYGDKMAGAIESSVDKKKGVGKTIHKAYKKHVKKSK